MDTGSQFHRRSVKNELTPDDRLALLQFRTWMEEKRFSLRPVAKMIGISHHALAYIVNGKRMPKPATARLIAAFLDARKAADLQTLKPRQRPAVARIDGRESCPFCASASPRLQYQCDGRQTTYWMACNRCGARGPLGESEAIARERWLLRPELGDLLSGTPKGENVT